MEETKTEQVSQLGIFFTVQLVIGALVIQTAFATRDQVISYLKLTTQRFGKNVVLEQPDSNGNANFTVHSYNYLFREQGVVSGYDKNPETPVKVLRSELM